MLRLTILGSGTSVPSTTRRSPAYLLRADAAPDAPPLALLVDCGSGCVTSLVQAGVTLDRLGGVLLTHLHPDHTADLLPLLFALSLPVGPQRSGELPLSGPAGTAERLQKLQEVYGVWVKPRRSQLALRELADREVLELGGLRVTAFAVEHMRNGTGSLAYRFELGGKVLCYSGDCSPCAGIEAAALAADLLVCECGSLEGERPVGHLTATDVGQLAVKAGCREVVLTHLYDHVVATDPVARVRAHFQGPVRLAEDGLELTLG